MRFKERQIKKFIKRFKKLEDVNPGFANDIKVLLAYRLRCEKDIEVIARVLAETDPEYFEESFKIIEIAIHKDNYFKLIKKVTRMDHL